ncbi:altronate dehydratase family protein [bacterium]|nr:altronate dehydratase family protein [bacterium]
MLADLDNVSVLTTQDADKGSKVSFIRNGKIDFAILNSYVPFGHKIAACDIEKGDPVIKFGQTIGFASITINKGDHVHVHNVKYSEKILFTSKKEFELNENIKEISKILHHVFKGFERKDGRVGIRNYFLVVSTVNCSATVARRIYEYFRVNKPKIRGFDGVVPLIHHGGCTEANGSYFHIMLNRTIAGWIENPNVIGALIVGIGCESTTYESILSYLSKDIFINKHIDHLEIQKTGGAAKTVEAGIKKIKIMFTRVDKLKRSEQPVSKLILATNCGGSDAFSSITANPALGIASDIIVYNGGTAILAETPECSGGREILKNRCLRIEDKEKIDKIFSWWVAYTKKNNVSVNDNISPGNIDGGITTILEKSLGAISKIGSSSISQVLEYAEKITRQGRIFMDTPGFDPVSVTGLVAGGCNIVAFTTGRGSMYGCSIAPTLKISTNTALANEYDEIDIDAGEVIQKHDLLGTGIKIYRKLIAVAGGFRTKSEINGVGMDEFVPWSVGAIL